MVPSLLNTNELVLAATVPKCTAATPQTGLVPVDTYALWLAVRVTWVPPAAVPELGLTPPTGPGGGQTAWAAPRRRLRRRRRR